MLAETNLDGAHSDSELQLPSDGQVPYLRPNNRWEEVSKKIFFTLIYLHFSEQTKQNQFVTNI